jgi:hypothetical protein
MLVGERKEIGMDTRVDEVLAISRDLFSLEEEERAIQAKIASARERLAKLVGQEVKPIRKRVHARTMPLPDATASGLDPALGDYGSRGGYGQRGKTGEVLALMKTMPDQLMSPDDVAKALGWPGEKEANGQVASRILQRLAQAGKLGRPHRGLYQLVADTSKNG